MDTRRPWSGDDIAKLKSLAGALPIIEIAAKLRRSPAAVTTEASKLKLSLRTRPGDVSTEDQNQDRPVS